MTSAILHQETPNWAALRSEVPEVAAKHLGRILIQLDSVEKQVFALRGMAMLIVEERELYRWVIDEEVGDYYQSFDRWLKQTCPNSWSYCRDALRAVKELRDVPFTDLLEIKRCNLEQLKKVSSNVRILPEVVKAAKQLPEKDFVAELNQRHAQHLEVKSPVVMAPTGDVEEFETAIALAIAVEGCQSRAEAIRAISINYIHDHSVEAETA